MSLKYFLDDYKEKREILKDFLNNDYFDGVKDYLDEKFFDKDYFKSIEKMLDSDANPSSEGSPELFRWLNVVLHDGKVFLDDDKYALTLDWRYNPDYKDSDDWSGKLNVKIDEDTVLCYTLWVSCGSFISVVKKNLKDCDIVDCEAKDLYEVAKYRLEQYEKHIADMEAKYEKEESIKKKLQAVDTANTLMNVFGLKLDEESQKKVEQWKKELSRFK